MQQHREAISSDSIQLLWVRELQKVHRIFPHSSCAGECKIEIQLENSQINRMNFRVYISGWSKKKSLAVYHVKWITLHDSTSSPQNNVRIFRFSPPVNRKHDVLFQSFLFVFLPPPRASPDKRIEGVKKSREYISSEGWSESGFFPSSFFKRSLNEGMRKHMWDDRYRPTHEVENVSSDFIGFKLVCLLLISLLLLSHPFSIFNQQLMIRLEFSRSLQSLTIRAPVHTTFDSNVCMEAKRKPIGMRRKGS